MEMARLIYIRIRIANFINGSQARFIELPHCLLFDYTSL